MNRPSLPRRQFLRGASSAIALPALASLGWCRRTCAAERFAGPPKRMVFLGMGYGVTSETWLPDVNQTGSSYTLPPGLAPLKRHQNDLSIVQGCTNKLSAEAHWGSTFWLTCANRYGEPGKRFHNSISADQVAASHLGQSTRFTSIQLNGGDPDIAGSGHGPGLSLAWDLRGKPIAGFNNPLEAFHRLFSPDTTPLEQRQALIAQQRSVLDTVLEDAKSLRGGLNRADADKLDEYFQSIRDIETRLSKEQSWFTVPKARPPIGEPAGGAAGREEIKIMYDLIVAALQTDSTRVLTYRQPVSSLLTSLGIKVAAHDMSHYAPGDRMDASQKRDLVQSELLAGLIDRLKATKEADGTSLFDHTVLVYGSNIRSIHYLDNCPTLITGAGANIKLGQHIVLEDKNTPLANVWLTLLKGIGLPIERHGDSTGVVKELIA
jgi:hypothetical protein